MTTIKRLAKRLLAHTPFAQEAMALIPDAVMHAVEILPGCAERLIALAPRHPKRSKVHNFALSDPEATAAG